jgi:hypothetical protein
MEINHHTKQYWTEEDLHAVKVAPDFKSLFLVAEKILNKMPQPIVQVCGPIGTGGLGNVDDNLNAFNEVIKSLQEKGLNVFDQMPFEWPMQGIKFNLAAGVYPESILTDFYLPIFESGLISEFYFMPNWKTSKGANWEHDQAQKLGIKINYLN